MNSPSRPTVPDRTDQNLPVPRGRDAGLLLTDQHYLIYDTERHTAWLQSDLYCSVDDAR